MTKHYVQKMVGVSKFFFFLMMTPCHLLSSFNSNNRKLDVVSLCFQIMIGEAILFCCLSQKNRGAGAEANINAAGCNFNSFIRRAIRFIGTPAYFSRRALPLKVCSLTDGLLFFKPHTISLAFY